MDGKIASAQVYDLGRAYSAGLHASKDGTPLMSVESIPMWTRPKSPGPQLRVYHAHRFKQELNKLLSIKTKVDWATTHHFELKEWRDDPESSLAYLTSDFVDIQIDTDCPYHFRMERWLQQLGVDIETYDKRKKKERRKLRR